MRHPRRRLLSTALLGLLLAQFADAQTPAPQARAADADELLLQVSADDQPVSDALAAYQSDDDVLLPLGELARVLTLAITTTPERGTANGFILDEDREFSLDAKRGVVVIDGRTEAVDPGQIDVREDDIYVASKLLARWLPVDLSVDLSTLALEVHPRERLPLQFRLDRERAAKLVALPVAPVDPGYPSHRIPYRWASAPFVDQTLSLDYAGRPDTPSTLHSRYTAYATGDLLRMQAALYVNIASAGDTSDVRLTLGRHDPDGGLLGPMRARTALIGSVAMPGIAHISRTSALGEGVLVSNRPLSQPTSFGRHSLQGPLPPGWDVELYFNGTLVGLQAADSAGQYHFPDLPLLFGPNEFRLVFHGPLGQLRVETQSFPLQQSITRKGEFYYSLAQQQDDDGRMRALAHVDWGVTANLAASGGIVRAPVGDVDANFAYLGMLGHWGGLVGNVDLIRAQDGGMLAQATARTRIRKWSLSASHSELRDFTSEWFLPSSDPVHSMTAVRADGVIALPGRWRLPATVEATRQLRASGASTIALSARLSTRIWGTAITGQVHAQSLGDERRADATLQMSRRVGGLSVRSQINYTLAPQRGLSAISLAADKRLGDGYLVTGSISRLMESATTIGTVGLTKSLGRFGLGINAGYSSRGEVTAGAQLFVGLGREPRERDWIMGALPVANSGAVSALVFLDDNTDGRRDANEQVLPGVGFTVDGGKHPVQTGVNGIAYLERLSALRHTDVALIAGTLEDPQWQPVIKGARLVPRPGAVAQLEFPVVMTSDVDGSIFARHGAGKLEIAGVTVEVVDSGGAVVATGQSGGDGYYVLTGVRPGEYQVRLPAAQLQRLGLRAARPYPLTIGREGAYVSDFDIELEEVRD